MKVLLPEEPKEEPEVVEEPEEEKVELDAEEATTSLKDVIEGATEATEE